MSTIEETLAIRVEGDEQVAGTFVTPGTLLPGVLFVHGWGGSQEQYLARARAVAGLGCICLTFNLRGHVETRPQFETVSRSKNLRDVEAAYDRLVARPHVDPEAIAVVGSSYGGYLASILTTVRPVRWLGLRAPALYLNSGWDLPKVQLRVDQDLVNYRRHIVDTDTNRALQACKAFEGDLLLVESQHDDIVPASVLTSYREAAVHTRSLTFRCIKDADHGLSSDDAQRAYTGVLVGWLKEMVAHARSGQQGQLSAVPPAADAAAPESPPPTISSVGWSAPREAGPKRMLDTVLHTIGSEFSDVADAAQITRIVMRLLLAALLGGLLGYEREQRGKAAGIRTHMLVAMGAALFVLIPQLGGMAIADMSRVIQGVVAGIGFLGAGAIIKLQSERSVQGLTTAAGVWLTAAIGIACGMGREATAVISALLALAVLAVPRLFDSPGSVDGDADDDGERKADGRAARTNGPQNEQGADKAARSAAQSAG